MNIIIKPCLYCQQTKMCIEETHIYENVSDFQVKCTKCGAMGPKEKTKNKAIHKHNGAHDID